MKKETTEISIVKGEMKKETIEMIEREYEGADFTIPEIQIKLIEDVEEMEGVKFKGQHLLYENNYVIFRRK